MAIPDGCSGPLGFMGRFGPQAIQGPVAALGLLVHMAGSPPVPQLQVHRRAGLAPYSGS